MAGVEEIGFIRWRAVEDFGEEFGEGVVEDGVGGGHGVSRGEFPFQSNCGAFNAVPSRSRPPVS